jgi:PRC-barrel domain
MLRSFTELTQCTVGATDGDIGSIEDVYIEDQGWTVRYLVVDTGTWLSERKVLVSPMSFRYGDHQPGRLSVGLTRAQVKDSPDVNTALPVSRQHELLFSTHYGYPPYWEGPYRWGGGALPGFWAEADIAPRVPTAIEREIRARQEESMDPHLRSAKEIIDYYLEAKDGEIGHVEELLVDDRDFAVRYMVIDTRNWWPGKKVVISPGWVDRVSYEESKVHVGMTRDTVQSAPEYDRDSLDRSFEAKLHAHYQKRGYWEEPQESWKLFPPPPSR